MSLDPLLQQQLGLVILLRKKTSGLLGVKIGRGRLVVAVRVKRVGSLGSGLLGEREKGLVQGSDYGTIASVNLANAESRYVLRELTGEERVRNSGSEDEDGTEDDSAEITRVGGERRDGDEETSSSKTDRTNSKRDSSSRLWKIEMSVMM